jgi:UPF0755 protein
MVTKSKSRPRGKTKSKSKSRAYISTFIGIIVIIGLILSYRYFKMALMPNVLLDSPKQEVYFYVPTGSEYDDVIRLLKRKNIVRNINSFEWLARKVDYPKNIHPGRYLIKKNMSNFELVRILRSGRFNIPVKLVINEFESIADLASFISEQLEIDSTELMKYLMRPQFLKEHGLNRQSVLCLFVPNTYEFYWNTKLEKFMGTMISEYGSFWNKSRLQKAQELELKPVEVSILASIVQKETIKQDEMGKIAGVYLNRLRRGMKLQADPTIKFLIRNRKVHRVYRGDLDISSAYNTYQNYGLPPGPICMPYVSTIDAVLDAEKHNYLYFCAESDLSGYHVFSSTYQQHSKYAEQYRRALNKRDIR